MLRSIFGYAVLVAVLASVVCRSGIVALGLLSSLLIKMGGMAVAVVGSSSSRAIGNGLAVELLG